MRQPHSPQAGPDAPLAIREDALHGVLREAVRVSRVIAVTDEASVIAVEFEQTSAVRSKPQRAVSVFEHCGDASQGRAAPFLIVKGIVRQHVGFPVKHA